MKTDLEPWKTNLEPWKTIRTNLNHWKPIKTEMEPWKTNLEPSKLTWSCRGWLWGVQVVTGDSQEEVMIFRDRQTLHHNIYIIISVLFLSGFAHKGICYTSATLCPQDNSSLAGVKLKLVQRLRLRTGLPWWILKKLDRLRLRDGLPWWIWKKWTNLDYIPDCPDGFVKMDNGNWWVVKEKGTIFRSALMSIDMTH